MCVCVVQMLTRVCVCKCVDEHADSCSMSMLTDVMQMLTDVKKGDTPLVVTGKKEAATAVPPNTAP